MTSSSVFSLARPPSPWAGEGIRSPKSPWKPSRLGSLAFEEPAPVAFLRHRRDGHPQIPRRYDDPDSERVGDFGDDLVGGPAMKVTGVEWAGYILHVVALAGFPILRGSPTPRSSPGTGSSGDPPGVWGRGKFPKGGTGGERAGGATVGSAGDRPLARPGFPPANDPGGVAGRRPRHHP
jgi:hypothetical protein